MYIWGCVLRSTCRCEKYGSIGTIGTVVSRADKLSARGGNLGFVIETPLSHSPFKISVIYAAVISKAKNCVYT
jgi:hypothetical protein